MARLWMGEVVVSPVAACCTPRARREQPRGRRGVQVLEELSHLRGGGGGGGGGLAPLLCARVVPVPFLSALVCPQLFVPGVIERPRHSMVHPGDGLAHSHTHWYASTGAQRIPS